MPDHYEQATANPNELRERLPNQGRILSRERMAFLRRQCEATTHELVEVGSGMAECQRCGSRFRLTEEF